MKTRLDGHVDPCAEGSFSHWVWDQKYRLKRADGTPIDMTVEDTFMRVADAIGGGDPQLVASYVDAMRDFEFLPAGRILAGAGTDRNVTLVNCYVMGPIEDSLDGIHKALGEAAATLKMGGGVGMDFSTLRPRGALVKGVDSVSSGAVSFMDLWNTMCGTIMSAGARRGAMMGVLRCDHPDIEEFITAKREAGRLTNFNVSVAITDEFMRASEADAKFDLRFGGKTYKTVRARTLWSQILAATHQSSEPGVLFIDRVNQLNPLRDIETIAASNPCGEQMLPPYGACVLGSINLARLVVEPFSPDPCVDDARLAQLARIATRFLNGVIDVTRYPLPQQREESLNKRRIGIGVTGVADALLMLGIGYHTDQARSLVAELMKTIQDASLDESAKMAGELAPYPLWRPSHGMPRRNSHLMSIAPTGTISAFAGNVSSGIEPIFAPVAKRRVLMPDGSHREFEVMDYAVQVARNVSGAHMASALVASRLVKATALKPEEHVAMVAAAQPYVDSAISKTVNVPADIDLDTFGDVYELAWQRGCKGCTTYRPSAERGAVLVEPEAAPAAASNDNVVRLRDVIERPAVIEGRTYKLKPPGAEHALYLTINDTVRDGRRVPLELFFNSKAVDGYEWTVALSRMISAVFRKGGDVAFVAEELEAVFSPRGGFWQSQRYYPSMLALIGETIRQHMGTIGYATAEPANAVLQLGDPNVPALAGKHCPKCQRGRLTRAEGCWSCDSCDFSKC